MITRIVIHARDTSFIRSEHARAITAHLGVSPQVWTILPEPGAVQIRLFNVDPADAWEAAALYLDAHGYDWGVRVEGDDMPQPDSDWMCAGCGDWFPVPSMARDHEARHDGRDPAEPLPYRGPVEPDYSNERGTA